MSEPKRYFWLKLHKDFFQRKEIKRLRKIAGGDTYTIIYLKMLLRSIMSDGKLYFDGLEDDFASELALDLDEKEENVQITVQYLLKSGLLEMCSDEEYYLPDTKDSTGCETAVASRVRKYREKQKALQCNTDVTNVKHLCNGEIEKEIEIEIEKEKELELEIIHSHASHDDVDKSHFEIIEYLNLKTGSKFKPTTKPYVQAIRSRLKEGYTISDFKTVIDKKCREWKGTKLEKYLTPKTLFAPSHFDTYLNSNEMASMTDTERKVAELNALIDAVERGTDETGNIESYGPTIDISEY